MRRRRFLVAATAAAALGLALRPQPRWEWRGDAMGAEARVVLSGPRDAALAATAAIAAEIDRLEGIFSLHRPESQLSRLNRDGSLSAPARDLVTLLARARHWTMRTEGAFDPAVQPLWEVAATGLNPETALERVRGARLFELPGELRLSPGAALTLNGIAQGYVADRVAELVRQHGFHAPFIDTGEMRFAGRERQTLTLPHAGRTLRLARCAAATSAPEGLRLAVGHHLFDPRTGLSPGHWRAVTVVAPDATDADALSTAFAISSRDRIGDLVPEGVAVIASAADGASHHFGRADGMT
jgi:FAD:protein FMN transferase